MIEKEFPWWGELHGWCNSTWSAADSGQDFTRHIVELFKLWPNLLSGDSVDPAAGPLNSSQLEEGEIAEGGNNFHTNDNFFADDSELMNVDSNPPFSHVEMPSFPIPSPSLLFSEQELLLPVIPLPSPSSAGSKWLMLLSLPANSEWFLLTPPPSFNFSESSTIIPPPPSTFNRVNSISLNDDPPPFVFHCPKLQPAHPCLKQDRPLLKHHPLSLIVFPPSITALSDDSNSKLSSKPSHECAQETPADKLSLDLASALLTFH
ncbi:hypothetical protein F5J12DRAFT_913905 [Pisolithus orientalis]|uniref:uncharacterized protein n=1 Tax=Pisolithus orientalis TaxID=936130 RepID=UPI002224F5CE|nr:uncharacterized protein F5J12DRAFT_913905 [Pisolithus orientalis]KAI6002435.1 hypothetical protein F5J12DRAFT_913905 [Pisolithus orientalis]